jgi:hypothetical protein
MRSKTYSRLRLHLYHSSSDYKALLDFVVRPRNFRALQCDAAAGAKTGGHLRCLCRRLADKIRTLAQGGNATAADIMAIWSSGACV